jgi:hypothetical protein
MTSRGTSGGGGSGARGGSDSGRGEGGLEHAGPGREGRPGSSRPTRRGLDEAAAGAEWTGARGASPSAGGRAFGEAVGRLGGGALDLALEGPARDFFEGGGTGDQAAVKLVGPDEEEGSALTTAADAGVTKASLEAIDEPTASGRGTGRDCARSTAAEPTSPAVRFPLCPEGTAAVATGGGGVGGSSSCRGVS